MRTAILSDIHGNVHVHEKAMRRYEYTLQLGDCGFSYRYLNNFDPSHHKVLGGNHDCYPKLVKLPHYLGDCGTWRGLFYVRGAYSIDKAQRIVGRDWWPEEELTYEEAQRALEAYEIVKPRIVVTHDAPRDTVLDDVLLRHSMFPYAGGIAPSRTRSLLSQMYEAHKPQLWIFGHWHTFVDLTGGPTRFVGLAENQLFEVESDNPVEIEYILDDDEVQEA